jgi:hypothetical protein
MREKRVAVFCVRLLWIAVTVARTLLSQSGIFGEKMVRGDGLEPPTLSV